MCALKQFAASLSHVELFFLYKALARLHRCCCVLFLLCLFLDGFAVLSSALLLIGSNLFGELGPRVILCSVQFSMEHIDAFVCKIETHFCILLELFLSLNVSLLTKTMTFSIRSFVRFNISVYDQCPQPSFNCFW